MPEQNVIRDLLQLLGACTPQQRLLADMAMMQMEESPEFTVLTCRDDYEYISDQARQVKQQVDAFSFQAATVGEVYGLFDELKQLIERFTYLLHASELAAGQGLASPCAGLDIMNKKNLARLLEEKSRQLIESPAYQVYKQLDRYDYLTPEAQLIREKFAQLPLSADSIPDLHEAFRRLQVIFREFSVLCYDEQQNAEDMNFQIIRHDQIVAWLNQRRTQIQNSEAYAILRNLNQYEFLTPRAQQLKEKLRKYHLNSNSIAELQQSYEELQGLAQEFCQMQAQADRDVDVLDQPVDIIAKNKLPEALHKRVQTAKKELYDAIFSCDAANLKQLSMPDVNDINSVGAFLYTLHHLNWIFIPERMKLSRTMEGHEKAVIAVAGQEQLLVTGSADNTIKVWNLATGTCENTLTGHRDSIYCLGLVDDKIVSGSTDNTVKIWDVENGECLRTLEGHGGPVYCLSVNGSEIVSGSTDKTIKRWNLNTGECLKTLTGHEGYIYSVVRWGDRIISASADKTIKIWDGHSGACLKTMIGHSENIYSLAVSGNTLVSGSGDETVKVWDLSTGSCVQTLEGHEEAVHSVTIVANKVISASNDKTIRVWDIDSGQSMQILEGHSGFVLQVIATGNRVVSVSSDKTMKIWQCDNLTNIEPDQVFLSCVPDTVTSLAGISLPDDFVFSDDPLDNLSRVFSSGTLFCISSGEYKGFIQNALERREQQRHEQQQKMEQLRQQQVEEKQRQQLQWRKQGCCMTCGKPLGWLDKLMGHTFCQRHRS